MSRADVVVVGGGHNGLVAAILAAQAGKSVTLLERSAQPGGATVGQKLFPPHPARLSRYSYLIALMPDDLVRRLGISLPLVSRAVSSYTPVRRNGVAGGLLVERVPGPATEQSFADLTGGSEEFRSWTEFYAEMHSMAAALAPMLTGPLARRSDARDAVVAAAGEQIWTDIVEEPLGTHDPPPVPGRHGSRRGGHRRADRHPHVALRSGTVGQPLLPVPPDRPRHRGMAGTGRRDGCADRCAGRQGSHSWCRHSLRIRRSECGREGPRGGVRYVTRCWAASLAR